MPESVSAPASTTPGWYPLGSPASGSTATRTPLAMPSSAVPPVQPQWSTPRPAGAPARPRTNPLVLVSLALVAGLIGGVVGVSLADGSSSVTTSAPLTLTPGDTSTRPDGSIAAIASAVLPTVVNIDVETPNGDGTGSGSIIQSTATASYILTNNHVVADASARGSITVTFQDESTIEAQIVGRDPSYDLAVLRIDRGGLPVLDIGDSSDVLVGDTVVAIGSPLGLSGTVTAGIVSALNRPVTAGGSGEFSYFSAIQTDAAINPGNSGGPLVNTRGQMIGVNSAIATLRTGAESGSIGLGFAIPTSQALRIVDEIITNGYSTYPIIGVQLDGSYTGAGARIASVDPGGPADQAGLEVGDVIIAVEGDRALDSTEVIVAIRRRVPGDSLELTLRRDGRERTVTVVLGSRRSLDS